MHLLSMVKLAIITTQRSVIGQSQNKIPYIRCLGSYSLSDGQTKCSIKSIFIETLLIIIINALTLCALTHSLEISSWYTCTMHVYMGII